MKKKKVKKYQEQQEKKYRGEQEKKPLEKKNPIKRSNNFRKK